MKILLFTTTILAMAAAGVATTASANVPIIGFVTTQGGVISAPQSSPGGHWALTSLGTGRYLVTLYGLGDSLDSDVQVAAQLGSAGPHYCTSAGWNSPNGTDVAIYVDCFGKTGAPLNADFSVMYQARTIAPLWGAIAFMWADQPTAAAYTPSSSYSFNSSGGVNTVTRSSPGRYFAKLPGFSKAGGNPQVTAFGQTAARCEIVDWSNDLSGATVAVQCVNAAGAPADDIFDLSFTDQTTEGASSFSETAIGGYALANDTVAGAAYTPTRVYNYNDLTTKPIKAFNAQNASFLSVAVPRGLYFESILGMMSAHGSRGEYCDGDGLGYYTRGTNERISLTTACFNAQGVPIYAEYSATLITSP